MCQPIAWALDALVRRAQGPQRRWWDLSQREAILENSAELHALAMTLTSDRVVYAAGVAHLRQLVTDGPVPRTADRPARWRGRCATLGGCCKAATRGHRLFVGLEGLLDAEFPAASAASTGLGAGQSGQAPMSLSGPATLSQPGQATLNPPRPR